MIANLRAAEIRPPSSAALSNIHRVSVILNNSYMTLLVSGRMHKFLYFASYLFTVLNLGKFHCGEKDAFLHVIDKFKQYTCHLLKKMVF